MEPLDLVGLTPVMKRSGGSPRVLVGLVDGPVAFDHPELSQATIREISGKPPSACNVTGSAACVHGTLVAGVLFATRSSAAPAICPDCSLLVRPLFSEATRTDEPMPRATPEDLAAAIVDCVQAGAHVVNLSVALLPSMRGESCLEDALRFAAERHVIIVAAAGNQGSIGSTALTRHPWIVPVIACDLDGKVVAYSNLGNSISRNGLSAPGVRIKSVATGGRSAHFDGTSAATPFVTGAIALLLSLFPRATGPDVRHAVTRARPRRANVVPPLLDAWQAYRALEARSGRALH